MGTLRNTEKSGTDKAAREGKMTGAQASYLKTLCAEAGEPFVADLNKTEASRRIDELRKKTGRGMRH